MITDDKDTSDDDLIYTRNKRKQLIESITAKGMPEDNKDRTTLLMALADMDRATLTKKKIKVDTANGDLQKQAMQLITAMYSDQRTKNLGNVFVSVHSNNTLTDDFTISDTVPGEMCDIGPTDTYDSFMGRLTS